MKVAAILTSNVMDTICRLPGVPTHDWCDRAAAGLARLHHPCVALCCIANLDARGFITTLELVGAAASSDSQPVASSQGDAIVRGAVSSGIVRDSHLNQARMNIVEGQWLGWNVGTLNEDLWFVSTASQQGLMPGRGPSLLNRRWEWMNPVDVLLGAVKVPCESGTRMLLVEVASADPGFRDTTRQAAVVAATLPMLSKRVSQAFDPGSQDRTNWLTPREELVMWHLVAGMKVPQIAALLHRSVYTVHDHVKSLHRKLNANNRGQLVSRALGHLGPLDMTLSSPSKDLDPSPAKNPDAPAKAKAARG
ncbi:MAG: helix-turn-helix transcriptional regulator [Phycisphaerales bacterium]|nr:helix-turn-helix transcriptional regulator [Phycisphaerales bacterium]